MGKETGSETSARDTVGCEKAAMYGEQVRCERHSVLVVQHH